MNKHQKSTDKFAQIFFRILFATFIMLVTGFSHAASPQAITALSNNSALKFDPNSVLLKFKSFASPAQKRNAHALINGQKIRKYTLISGLEHIRLGQGQSIVNVINRLRKLPFVERVEPDYVLRTNTNDTFYKLQWGLENTGQDINGITGVINADIDADEAWTKTTGDASFVVAVIDTGVEYTHADLANNIWTNTGETAGDGIDNDGNGYVDDIHGWDFYSADSDPMDADGHGTHVAGTICAEGNNGLGVSGVAWQCEIMALRFLGPNGGFTSDAIAALDYAVRMGVKVSNNSWGSGGYSQSLYDSIQLAGTKGHLFITAAGNDGSNTDSTPHYPASYNLKNIISVAATDNKDQLAGFSNYGASSVDIGAPGVNILSTMLSVYYWGSGTSTAAPYVTGVAALIFVTHPNWNHIQVKNQIYNTVRPIQALNGKTVTGGVVNAYDALFKSVVTLDPKLDSDNDGMFDQWEIDNGFDPNDSSDCPTWVCGPNSNGWRSILYQ
jgi:subtilisin family serine protease